MKRTDEREIAFKTIYSKFFNTLDEDFEIDGVDAKSLEFTTEILNNFAEHYEEINSTISANLKGYTIERVYKVDLAILVLAVIELNYIKTPKEIVINEAVELAKKFSTEKSPKFINGFLASIVKD